MNLPISLLLTVVLTWMSFDAVAQQGPEGSQPPPPPISPEVGRSGNEGNPPELEGRPPQVRERVERREIVREFDRPPAGDRPRGQVGNGWEAERREVARRLEQIRDEHRELVAQGKEAEAAFAAQRIRNLERRLDSMRRLRDGSKSPRQPRPQVGSGTREGEFESDASSKHGDERSDHLRRAIEHLHAAGWHDVADRLARALKQVEARRPEGGERKKVGDESERGGRDRGDLQGQMQELRRQVDELRRRLDRQGGDRS